MPNLEPEIKIRAIDLADKWVARLTPRAKTQEALIKNLAERFDQAYKAIAETIASQ